MAELCDVARLNNRRWNARCGLSYLVNLADTEGCEVVGGMTGLCCSFLDNKPYYLIGCTGFVAL